MGRQPTRANREPAQDYDGRRSAEGDFAALTAVQLELAELKQMSLRSLRQTGNPTGPRVGDHFLLVS